MATSEFPKYTEPSNHEDPIPGVVPWQDDKGVWHFGGSESHGSGAQGGSAPVPGNTTGPNPPPVPPGGTSGPNPNAMDWGSFLTTLSGGLLNGLGQIFGQQRRSSFRGTEADPVTALAGVQRRIADTAPLLQSRMETAPTLSGPDPTAGVRRASPVSTPPSTQDVEHLKNALRTMGVNV